jgi:hypothetical protein
VRRSKTESCRRERLWDSPEPHRKANSDGHLTPKLSAARHGRRTTKALYLSDFTHLPSPKLPRAFAAARC